MVKLVVEPGSRTRFINLKHDTADNTAMENVENRSEIQHKRQAIFRPHGRTMGGLL